MSYPVIDESWYVRSPHVPQEISCGGVVLRLDAHQIYVALVKERHLPKHVLPKGHLEPGESLEQAARREILEEAGLSDLTLVANLGCRDRLSYSKQTWKVIHYFLFTTQQRDGTPTDPDHAYQLDWFSLDALPDLFWPEQRALLELVRSQLASFLP